MPNCASNSVSACSSRRSSRGSAFSAYSVASSRRSSGGSTSRRESFFTNPVECGPDYQQQQSPPIVQPHSYHYQVRTHSKHTYLG